MTNQASSTITLECRVRISPDVLLEPAGDESVLLDLTSESYFGLNQVGTRIWRLLESNPEVRVACETVQAEYDVPAPRLQADVLALIGQLADAGLVTIE